MELSEIESESYFSKIETSNGKTLYSFIDFTNHILNVKYKFDVGKISVFEADSTDVYYTADLNSDDSYNINLEWNEGYFLKIRRCFYKRPKDVSYIFEKPESSLDEQNPILRILFKLKQGVEVTAFQAVLKPTYVSNAFGQMTDFMFRFSYNINKQLLDMREEVRKEKEEKNVALKELSIIADKVEESENSLIKKCVLLINEKKKKIKNLKEYLGGNAKQYEKILELNLLNSEEVKRNPEKAPEITLEKSSQDTKNDKSKKENSHDEFIPDSLGVYPDSLQSSQSSRKPGENEYKRQGSLSDMFK